MYLWIGILLSTIVLFIVFAAMFKAVFGSRLDIRRRLRKDLSEKREENEEKKDRAKTPKKSPLKKMLFFVSSSYIDKVDDQLSMAGIPLKAEEYLAIRILSISAIPALILFFEGNLIVCAGFAIMGAMLPPVILALHARKRRNLFHMQLSDALSVICNSLKSGFSLPVAMGSISHEMPDPIGKEFARLVREMQLGMSLEEGFQRMVRRTQCEDLELLATTIIIQRQTGGNLAEILDNISQTIKDRIALANETKLLTTTGRTSGYVIGLLPVFLLVGLMILNPGYVAMFFETGTGKTMLAAAAAMELIGFLLVRKVISIKY
ncbi:MAG: type II secretion system F family protein [Bacillota bacterium]|jgi:tight adherence protein B|nr:type II secretion system F family protein [Bacillota bacterium]